MLFNITPKEVFENSGIKYSIFHIKEQKRKKKYQNAVDKKSTDIKGSITESELSEEENNSDNFDEKYEGKGLNVSMPTMRPATSVRATHPTYVIVFFMLSTSIYSKRHDRTYLVARPFPFSYPKHSFGIQATR